LNIRRGDIYYADLSPVVGSEQGGIRPVLIVQNNVGNRFSPTVIAAAITSQQSKANLPTHIPLHADSSGLAKDSVVLLEQVRTIDKKRLKEKMGTVDENSMNEINNAISISFGHSCKHITAAACCHSRIACRVHKHHFVIFAVNADFAYTAF
jgi:mRNA interferase MazF